MIYGISVLIILIISSIVDIRKKEISIWAIRACMLVSVIRVIAECVGKNLDAAETIVCLLPGVFLLCMAFLSRQSVGYGDGLLALCAAPALGANATCLGFLAAIFISGITSALLLVIKKVGKNSRLPFVPFMTVGMGVALFATV